MAYVPNNLGIIVHAIGGTGIRLISYRTDDPKEDLLTVGYFEDAREKGLRRSDMVFVTAISGNEEPYALVIETIEADGSGTAILSAADTALQLADVADVAISGDYGDLENKPLLGTASEQDVDYFALAAQAVPAGGTTGQVLTRSSDDPGDWEWSNNGTGDMLGSTYDPDGDGLPVYPAANHTYDNTASGIAETKTQAAIDKLTVRGAGFPTVAALLADTSLAYSAGLNKIVTASNEIVEAGGYRYQIASAVASDHDVTTAGGVKLYALPNADGSLHDVQFGATLDGQFDADTAVGTDATAILQKWLDSPRATIKRFTGVSRISSTVYARPGDIIEGTGFTSGITGKQIGALTDTAVLACWGDEYVQVADLSADIDRGVNQIQLASTAGIDIGDWLLIQNPTASSWVTIDDRSTYRAGEWLKVHRIVDENNITVFGSTRAAYAAADVDIYVNKNPGVTMRNFRVEAPYIDGRSAVQVNRVVAPVIENLRLSGTMLANMSVRSCITPYVNLRNNTGRYDATPDNDYDLSIGSCFGGLILGDYFAQRHGIAIGNGDYIGNVPNRDLTIMANTSNTLPISSIDAGGHGCSENLTVIGGTHTGATIGGKGTRFIGSKIRSGTPSAGRQVVSGSEFVGGDFVFDNCEFEQLGPDGNSRMFGFTLVAPDASAVRLYFNNCIFKPHPTTVVLLLMQNVATPAAPAVYINGGRIVDGGALTQIIRCQRTTSPGTAASNFEAAIVRNLEGIPASITTGLITNAGTGLTIDKSGYLDPIKVSTTFDPPSIAAGGVTTTDITTTGLSNSAGWYCEPRFSLSLGGLIISAWIPNSTTVRVSFFNPTANPIDLGSGTLSVLIRRD